MLGDYVIEAIQRCCNAAVFYVNLKKKHCLVMLQCIHGNRVIFRSRNGFKSQNNTHSLN